ncbi:MAG: D-glycero-beta-D-manno-heptose 1-phosphate adenylyltransferase [Zetaproteobacteria bacterium]|nr:D-glycero-beta-D-manno-heptose 1-phosphate adenylyltransferase [Pseudobdellovibrionaceae bacterium]
MTYSVKPRVDDFKKLPWDEEVVVVVGDLILDEYLEGMVNRISPEAPVPVHLVTKSSCTAGGAANVARNIQLAGGKAVVCGVLGKDAAASQLLDIMTDDGIDVSPVLLDDNRVTVKKTRITSNNQQLVRIDWEKVEPISLDFQDRLLEKIKKIEADAILLSDYGKGSLTKEFLHQVISHAKSKNIPVIVDPKGKDYSLYSGADLVTPNRKEACEALGVDSLDSICREDLAKQLQKRYKIKNIMVTLGAEGMYCLPESGSSPGIYLPAQTREVFDVSGAGDTVVAMMALSMASGASLNHGMYLANLAAGRVVEKWGTQPIHQAELVAAIKDQTAFEGSTWFSSESKVVGLDELKDRVGEGSTRSPVVVFTNGCFDILHAGHVSYLEAARARGDVLVVGVNSDKSVKRLKGEARPIIPSTQRMYLLAALSCVDYVVEFDEDTPRQLIDFLVPNVLVKGADYELDEIVGADTVTANGGSVERIDFVEGLSTTKILEKIKSLTQGDINIQ